MLLFISCPGLPMINRVRFKQNLHITDAKAVERFKPQSVGKLTLKMER
jgi:hypothetical protein